MTVQLTEEEFWIETMSRPMPGPVDSNLRAGQRRNLPTSLHAGERLPTETQDQVSMGSGVEGIHEGWCAELRTPPQIPER